MSPDAAKVATARDTLKAQRPAAAAEERALRAADGYTILTPAGPTGTAAPVSYAGIAGPAGPLGAAGVTGPTGATGATGPA